MPRSTRTTRRHGFLFSGHVHRVRLLLLDLPFEESTVELMQGEHKGPEFLGALGTADPAIHDLGMPS